MYFKWFSLNGWICSFTNCFGHNVYATSVYGATWYTILTNRSDFTSWKKSADTPEDWQMIIVCDVNLKIRQKIRQCLEEHKSYRGEKKTPSSARKKVGGLKTNTKVNIFSTVQSEHFFL